MEVERVFSILLEDTAGMSANYWIERRRDGYHLMNVEIGHCGGPFPSAVEALTCDGTEYGGDHIELTSNLHHFEFAKMLMAINYDDARLKVNGLDVKADFIAVMELYNSQQAAKLTGVDALMQQMSDLPSLPMHSDDPSLAMSVDRESSLFSMTPQQRQEMVEQARAEFLSAKKPSTKESYMENSNKPETEEDGIRAEALRRLKVRMTYAALPAQTRDSSPPPSSSPATTESNSDAKPNTSR